MKLRCSHLLYSIAATFLRARLVVLDERTTIDGPVLPPEHPGRVSNHNYGLPDACMTYSQRYAGHEEPRRQDWAPNAANPNSRFVVLVRLHSTLTNIKHDIFTSLRALVAEATESGYHVYFLYQITNPGPTTLEEAAGGFPLDLRRLVVVFNEELVAAVYSAIPGLSGPRGIVDEKRHGAFNHPGPRAVYLANVFFMHMFAAYDFCWVLEHDVRYVGHWGRFLNAALNVAADAPRVSWLGDEDVFAPREVSVHLRALERLPDLINFQVMRHEGNNWGNTVQGMDGETVTSGLQLYGGSRRLYNILHDYSKAGKSAYLEAYVPTVARRENLTMVAVGHPRFDAGPAKRRRHARGEDGEADDTWKCCSMLADHFYADWFRTGHCRHSVLLHPVKLEFM